MLKKSLLLTLLMALIMPLAMQAQGLMKAPKGTALQTVTVQNREKHPATQTREAGWLQYDDGTRATFLGASTAYYWTYGPMYPSSMLGNNNTLSKISFYECSYMITDVTFEIYSGGDEEPETLLYTEDVTPSGEEGFHEFELAQAVTIDPSQNLWIVLTVGGTYVMPLCLSDEPNNNWIDNGGWGHLSDMWQSGYGWMVRAYVEYNDPSITCPKPTQLAASNITTNAATLTWSSSEEVDTWQLVYSDVEGFDPDNATPIDVDRDPTYTLTNLSDATTYYAYVRSVCDGSSYSAWSSMVTFTTISACATPYNTAVSNITQNSANISWEGWQDSYVLRYTVPAFFDDFENGLDNWTIITAGEAPQDNGWYTVNPISGLSFNAHSGSYVASAWSWNSSAYDADNWLITPEVELGGTLSFWVRTNSGYPDSYEVLLATEGNDTTNFTTTLQAMAPAPATGEWAEVTIDLSAYSGTGYIAIHHEDYDMNYLLIDDFLIEAANATWTTVNKVASPYTLSGLSDDTQYIFQIQGNCPDETTTEWTNIAGFTTLPLCVVPSDLSADDITTTSAVITWTSDASSFDIEIDGVVTEGLTEASYTLNDLDPGTIYTVRVRANCGETGYSAWTGNYYFATECNAFDLPYEYGFEDVENNDSDLNCWWYASANSANGIGVTDYDDNYVFFFSSYEQASNYAQMLMSPELNTEAAVKVEFDYIPLSTQYGNESFVVGYSADGDNFTWGDEIEADNTEEWTTFSEVFPEGTKYVAIYYTSQYLTYLLLDNFSFTEATGDAQTVELTEGWNWFSTYIEMDGVNGLDMVKAGLGENGLVIRNSETYTEYDGEWWGDLDDIPMNNEEMYMIQVDAACTFEMQGAIADPTAHEITINPGWNWIGFPCSETLRVVDALADFDAEEGDVLRGSEDYTEYDGEWWGELETLVPGQGYMYFSASRDAKTLIYKTKSDAKRTIPNVNFKKQFTRKQFTKPTIIEFEKNSKK